MKEQGSNVVRGAVGGAGHDARATAPRVRLVPNPRAASVAVVAAPEAPSRPLVPATRSSQLNGGVDRDAGRARPGSATGDAAWGTPAGRLARGEVARFLAADVAAVLLLLASLVAVVEPLIVLGVAVTMLGVWRAAGLYQVRMHLSALDDLPAMVSGLGVGTSIGALVSLALPSPDLTSLVVVAVGLGVTAPVARALAYVAVRRGRVSGRRLRTAVVVGDGEVARTIAGRIHGRPSCGLRVALVVRDHRHLVAAVHSTRAEVVVIAEGPDDAGAVVAALGGCRSEVSAVYVVPRLAELHRAARSDDQVWGVPLLRVTLPRRVGVDVRTKRLFDVVMASAALAVLTPVLAVVALAVRIELGRGVLFRQTRVGRDGQEFELLKFRSMRPPPPGQESAWTVTGKRIGPVGRTIRRFSLDELPQFLNVVRGDMSLVGPRPERPEYVARFGLDVPRYGDRHRVPVGLTGLAAVEGLRGDTSIEERAHFDNWYIENWSLWTDLKVLMRTFTALVRGTGS